MPSKAVVLVVASFLIVVLIFSLYSTPVVFARIKAGPIHCFNLAEPDKVGCCQTFTYANGTTKEYCTICDNTIPPSNCSPRFQTAREAPPASPPTSVLPPSNNTGTAPPGSIIKVPIGSATNPSNNTSTASLGNIIKTPVNHTNALPPGNNTGNSIAMMSSDNPPGCSKKDPIPLNCTLNPFGNSGSNKAGTVGSATNPSNNTGKASLGNIIKVPVNHTNALPTVNNTGTPPPPLKLSQPSLAGQQPQMQQTTGHHHKGTPTSSSGSNSTGH